jgi:hypothetical protein
MRKLFFILSIIPFITSCLKYSQPKSLSLSGEYVIDKITYQETDGTPSPQDSTYLTGSVYYDNSEIKINSILNNGTPLINIMNGQNNIEKMMNLFKWLDEELED